MVEPNLDNILRENQHVDAEKLRQSIELAARLEQDGVMSQGYTLPPPFARRRAETVDSTDDDSRIVRLTSRRTRSF